MATKNKLEISELVSAALAGAAFNFAAETAAKKIDFVDQNFLEVKSSAAALAGTAMIYFGSKDAKFKAAGYALLGVAGASIASKINLVASGDGSMQGMGKSKQISQTIQQAIADLQLKRAANTISEPSTNLLPNNYAQLAFLDIC